MRLHHLFRHALSHPEQARRAIRNRLAESVYFLPGGRRAFPPSVVYLAVNSRCNLRCRTCDVGQGVEDSSFHAKLSGPARDMDPGQVARLLDGIVPARPRLSITSTEPLLHPALPDILALARSRRMPTQLTTNGWLLAQKADDLVAAGLDELTISLDGPAALHDRLRGVAGSFARAMEGWRRVNELKVRARPARPLVSINFTICPDNASALTEFLQAVAPMAPDWVSFSHYNFVTPELAEEHNRACGHVGMVRPHGVAGLDPGAMDTAVLWDQLKRVKGMSLGFPVFFAPEMDTPEMVHAYYRDHCRRLGRRTCFAPWKHAQVLADGTLTVLTRCFDVSLGNVFQTPLATLWNGPAMRAFRAELRHRGQFPACRRCCGVF